MEKEEEVEKEFNADDFKKDITHFLINYERISNGLESIYMEFLKGKNIIKELEKFLENLHVLKITNHIITEWESAQSNCRLHPENHSDGQPSGWPDAKK